MLHLSNIKQPVLWLVFATICQTSIGQELKELSNPWPLNTETYYQGFDEPVAGTELDYFPFLEKGNVVMYLGENGLYPSITFQTENIPEDYNEELITFIWQAAIGKSVGSDVSEFQMLINNKEFMMMNSHKEGRIESWQYTKNGTQLSFVHTSTGKATGELFGYMFLELPVQDFEKGKPVTIRFDEIKSYNKDFFMTVQNRVEDKHNLQEEAAILKTENGPKQTVRVELTHIGAPVKAIFKFKGEVVQEEQLALGNNEFYLLFDPVVGEQEGELVITVEGKNPISQVINLKPVRHFEVYFLPHSHVDIGFTHEQDEVARLQWKNLDLALDLVEKTKDFPDGSRYKWNAEISWVLDGYLKQASEDKKKIFVEAVENGSIGIDALYGSTLTGIQREEELFHNTTFANDLIREYGFDVQSAMITDVPGYAWGMVPSLAQTGINYFSIGPNHMPHLPHGGAQVGHTIETWGDRPFYWKSPSGKDKVLFWMSTHGYSWFHSWSVGNISHAGGTPVINFLDELEQQKYPYDMVQLRYNIGNDNGPPDPDMPAFFKEWNEKYEWPKFKIATTMEMMTEFESRYKDDIPEAAGDFTPYWEDGAASSATETSINRNAADRLIQAETLWSMVNGENYPAQKIKDAWTNVVLFSEHTWGALQSKSDPDGEFTIKLWDVKKSFTLDAQKAAEESVEMAISSLSSNAEIVEAIQVINTLSWERTDLVKLSSDLQLKGNRVFDQQGNEVPTQLLSSGELAFVAGNIPALGSSIYTLKKGSARPTGSSFVTDNEIGNNKLRVGLNAETGFIESIKSNDKDYIDAQDSLGFNAYWYSGHILEDLSRNHSPKISIKENGPLVSSIVVNTEGAGANGVYQEIEVVSGLDKISLVNIVDKLKVTDNENVRFSFPFDIPDGDVRIGIPWAVLQPGTNQLAGANKNFYSAQRFLDVSNNDYGITLTTTDAPIWEVGEMSGQYWMTDIETRPWIKKYKPSQTLFAWTMNNAWFVNYKAYQDGNIKFRHSLVPHEKFNPADAKKAGMEESMPLIVVPTAKKVSPLTPPFTITGAEDVLVTSFKPSADGEAWMVRFFNSSDEANEIDVTWTDDSIGTTNLSTPLEIKGDEIGSRISMVPWDIVTIRVSKK